MAKVELGLKRTCLSCDMRFYDFKRRPIICPGCGTEFDPENLLKGRKSRAAPKSATKASLSDDAADLDETEFDDEDVKVAVIKDDNDNDNDNDNDDIDFDEDDVDVDDTDGPGIIQDDITDGDELLPNLDDKDDQQASCLLDVSKCHQFGDGVVKKPVGRQKFACAGRRPCDTYPTRRFGTARIGT